MLMASVERRWCDGGVGSTRASAAWPDEDMTPVGDVLTALRSALYAPGHHMSTLGGVHHAL